MTTKIELHVLQSFPPANLNRDDTNTPKSCEFGGVRRARVSSQCLKRSIRFHPDFAEATGVKPADRTRLLAGEIKKSLVASGKGEEDSQKVAVGFVSALLGGMDGKKEDQSKVLFFISEEEKQTIVKKLGADWEKSLNGKFDDLLKEYKKTFARRTSAPEIALFGRMLAEDPDLNLNAACQVAHAISTHRVNMESDFFTAVDTLQVDGETGAGMMGATGYNSATFYRYAAVDVDLLLKNLGDEKELAHCTLVGFLRAAVKAIPTGKQNAFGAQTMPAFIMLVVRKDGQAWSLANAFEKPVSAGRDGGFLDPSIVAMQKHWQRLNKMYGDPRLPAKAYGLALDDFQPADGVTVVDSLTELESKLAEVLRKGELA